MLLARAEARQLAPKMEAVRVGDVLRECRAAFEEIAENRRLLVKWNVPDEVMARTDAGLLAVVLGNVLDNAASYCNEHGFVEVAAWAEGVRRLLFEV